MPFDFGQREKRERDRKLRGALLDALERAKGRAALDGLTGNTLVKIASLAVSPLAEFEDNGHVLSLFVDLENKGLVTIERKPIGRHEEKSPALMFLKITDKGSQLLRWSIDPDPDVDDGRAE